MKERVQPETASILGKGEIQYEQPCIQKNHVPAGPAAVHLSSVHAGVGKRLAGRE